MTPEIENLILITIITLNGLIAIDFILTQIFKDAYLKFSIPMKPIPSNFRIEGTDSFQRNSDIHIIEDNKRRTIYCSLKGIQHIYGGPILKFKTQGERIEDQRICITPFKLFFYIALFIIGFNFINHGFKNEPKDSLVPSVMLFWLGIGFVFNLFNDIKSLLEALSIHPVTETIADGALIILKKEFSRKVRRLKVRFFTGFILYLPLAAILIPQIDHLLPRLKDISGFLYFFCFAGWLAYHDWLLRYLHCPVCNNLFFNQKRQKNLRRNECTHCKFSLKENSP